MCYKCTYLDDLVKRKVINIVAILFLQDHEVGELADVVAFVHDFLNEICLFVLHALRVELSALGLCLDHMYVIVVRIFRINLFFKKFYYK